MGSSNGGKEGSPAANGVGDAKSDPAAASDSPSSATYSEGEKVLAFHGPRLYEAKIQKAEIRKKEWRYFVHYTGWNKNWDEWVGPDRLLKFTEENRQKQEAIDKRKGDKLAKSGRPSQNNKPRGPSIDAKLEKEDIKNHGQQQQLQQQQQQKGKKRSRQAGGEPKDTTRSLPKVSAIQFPLTLKRQLVDEWGFITQQGKLVRLPRTPNVDDILKNYLEYRTKKDGMVSESVAEILKGIRCYFDKALLAMLLYKKEKQQYHDAVTGNISPSTIYGAEHLLRLFVKLPELLSYVNMEESAYARLQENLLDFLKFLQAHHSTYFLSSYECPKTFEESGE